MIPVRIAAVGMTQFGKSSNTLVELLRDAAVTVLSDGLLDARTRSDPRMLLKRNPDLANSTVLKHLANQLTAIKKYCNRLRAQAMRSFDEIFKDASAVKFPLTFKFISFFWRCLMSLERICSKTVVTISSDASVLEAAKLMHSKHIGCLVVTDDSRITGILTDRDIVLKLVASEKNPAETAVKTIMTSSPTMVNINYDVLDAVRLMRNRGVRRLPVIDEHRHLLGIITMDDVMTAFGAEIGDLAGAVQKELGLEAAAGVEI